MLFSLHCVVALFPCTPYDNIQCQREINTADGKLSTGLANPSMASPSECKTKWTPHIMHPSAHLMALRLILVLTVPVRLCPAVRVVPQRPCHLDAVPPLSLSECMSHYVLPPAELTVRYHRPLPGRLPTFTTRHHTWYHI